MAPNQMQQEHIVSSTLNMDAFRSRNSLTDMTLVCRGDKQMKAHKLVLCANSSYFASDVCKSVWELDGVTEDCMEYILTFLYIGGVQGINESADTLKTVLAAAYKFEITLLRDYCWDELYKLLTPNSVLEFCSLAKFHTNRAMEEKGFSFLAGVMKEMAAPEILSAVSSDRLCEILTNDAVKLAPADDILKCIITWVECDAKKRTSDMYPFMLHVDLGKLTMAYLKDLILENALVKDSLQILNKLAQTAVSRMTESALSAVDLPLKRKLGSSEPDESPAKTKRTADINLVAFAAVTPKYKNQFNIFSYLSKSWQKGQLPFDMVPGMTPVYCKNTIMLVGGGAAAFTPSASVVLYNMCTYSFKRLCDLNTARHRPGVVAVKGSVYVIAGETANRKMTNFVERYDHDTNTWNYVAPTVGKHKTPIVVNLLDEIYIVGPHNVDVERYNPEANQWTVITTLPDVLLPISATAFNGNIAISQPNRLLLYMPVVDKWTTVGTGAGGPVITKIWSMWTGDDKMQFLLGADMDRVIYEYHKPDRTWTKLTQPLTTSWSFWQSVLIA